MRHASRHPATVSATAVSATVSAAVLFAAIVWGLSALPLAAQTSQPEALAAIRSAVDSEIQASRTDQSIWSYQEHDVVPGKNATYTAIETRQGTLRRMTELDGEPLSPAAAQAETLRIDDYVHNPAAQARARKNGAHDDAQAAELLHMLPDAFLWSLVTQSPEFLTLSFRPNPAFDPPNTEARVMSMMAGQVLIARDGNRIRTFKGQLTQNISIAFGLVRMYKGGSFDIERRQVGGGHWQITATHVHIGGHAFLFKNIGQQEDDVKTDWQPSTDDTLEQAAHTLNAEP